MQTLEAIKDFIWGPPLLLFLAGTGIYLTLLLRGVQFRYLKFALLQVFAKEQKGAEGDISQFQSLMTSLAGAVGTGTIVGVATAVSIGGLGALFWMWVMAILGMATKYSESLLAVKYRSVDRLGEMSGGPMHYIERGLGWKKLALFFAFTGTFAALTTGNLVQANAIAQSMSHMTAISPLIIGMMLALLTGATLIGGVGSIGKVAAVLVPFMALFYFLGALWILFINAVKIPDAFLLIFKSAFQGQAAFGGFMGSTFVMAVQMGVTRSIFSNEAGLGISSIAAAAAKTDSAGRQAMVTMTGALLSTMVLCSMTGLVLAVTDVMSANVSLSGASLVLFAFDSSFKGGGLVVMIGLMLFAFSTIVAWGYYGEKCTEYLFGPKSILYFRFVFCLFVIPGAIMQISMVWHLADISNGLLVIPNLIALLALSPVLKRETETFTNDLIADEC